MKFQDVWGQLGNFIRPVKSNFPSLSSKNVPIFLGNAKNGRKKSGTKLLPLPPKLN
jgi:hypothetical protein